ncbi:hypothetical protein TrVFT333_000414 [Trichoderma virens FT-333]|nr:hypothetical protein TrVFT333_000414 [Trichoderma virens FT-333]
MMSSTNEEDPFLQVQQCPQPNLIHPAPLRVIPSHPLPRLILHLPELTSARAELETALSSLSEDLADLVASVQAIESNPSQFGISDHEASRRKRLVQEVGAEIQDMREELNKNVAGGGGGNNDLPDPSSFAIGEGDGGDAYNEFEQQQQMEIMQEQDRHLDGVFHTVGNLRRQADDMGRELEEQNEMLEVVDDLADRVGSRLQTGMAKLQYVMRKNEDRLSSCCIAVLIFVLILLLVLLLIL